MVKNLHVIIYKKKKKQLRNRFIRLKYFIRYYGDCGIFNWRRGLNSRIHYLLVIVDQYNFITSCF